VEVDGSIGKYQVQGIIAHGGMGSVYRAFDPTVSRLVALKILPADSDPEILARFQTEAFTIARLRHPNIVDLFDFGEAEGRPYLVMELVEGEVLSTIIQQGQFSLLQKMDVLVQAAKALGAAHAQGVVHRDVKPGNIMVQPDGVVKVMDFGIARIAGQSAHTSAGGFVGTMAYIAPERLQNVEADARSDMFSYGVVAYELLAGRHPFRCPDLGTTLKCILTSDPASLLESIPECPPVLAEIVSRTLNKNPDLRYTDFHDLLSDLEPVLADLKAARAASLADQARDLIAKLDFVRGMSAVRESLQLDPSDSGARELLATLRQKLRLPVPESKPAEPSAIPAVGAVAPAIESTVILRSSPTQLFRAASESTSSTPGHTSPILPDATQLFRASAGQQMLPEVYLAFKSAPDRMLAGRPVRITKVPFRIGRSQGDLQIPSDKHLSRLHATIDWKDGVFVLKDEGSSNGTYLEGRKVTQPQPLLFGATIWLSSSTVLTFTPGHLVELPDLTGELVGERYELLRAIRLGIKPIYEARDIRLSSTVAVKLLSPSLTTYAGYLKQFKHEAEVAARLRHPHICPILDYGHTNVKLSDLESGQAAYICSGLLNGGDLQDRLAVESRINPAQALIWLEQVSSALDYAHSEDVIHGNLKPTSVVFDNAGKAYLTEFAIGSVAAGKGGIAFLATPDYMAPEQWEGLEAGPATDQFALAILAYLMLTGDRPFESQIDPDSARRTFEHGPVPAHLQAARHNIELPSGVSDVLRRALSPNPQDRYTHAGDFYSALQQGMNAAPMAPATKPTIFLSYRRDESAMAARVLATELEGKHGVSVFLDTERVDTAVPFPDELERAIAKSDIFLCLLGKTTLASAWVQTEIDLAWKLKKPMIPVFQERFVAPKPAHIAEPVAVLLKHQGVHLLDRKGIYIEPATEKLAKMVIDSVRKARATRA
jgi:serine/threonine protein kinase